MTFEETEFGFTVKNQDCLVFFGKHNSTIYNLRSAYPLLEWSWAKQVHGDNLIEAPNSPQQEADALWTKSKKLGLIIRTADCMPVMGINKSTQAIISIHAGWRGVASQIIPKSLKKLENQSHPLNEWNLFIGPHIMQNSFHIKDDTYMQLKSSTSLADSKWIKRTDSGYQANLFQVVLSQLQEIHIDESQITSLLIDTPTDLRLHSYRRDRENSGRQISFIASL